MQNLPQYVTSKKGYALVGAGLTAVAAVAVAAVTFAVTRDSTLDCTVRGVQEEYHISLTKERGWQTPGLLSVEGAMLVAYDNLSASLLPNGGKVTRSPASGEAARGRFAPYTTKPVNQQNQTPAESTYTGVANVLCEKDDGTTELAVPLTIRSIDDSVSPQVGVSYKLIIGEEEGKPRFKGMGKK